MKLYYIKKLNIFLYINNNNINIIINPFTPFVAFSQRKQASTQSPLSSCLAAARD